MHRRRDAGPRASRPNLARAERPAPSGHRSSPQRRRRRHSPASGGDRSIRRRSTFCLSLSCELRLSSVPPLTILRGASCATAEARTTQMLNNPIDLMRLRADQNGSLVAPQSLRDAFERHARAEMDDAELRAIEDEAIVDVVRKQEAIGWPIVTDGEFRRRNFQESFSAAVSGFDVPAHVERLADWREPNRPLHRTEQNFDAAGPAITTRRGVVERLSLQRNVVLDEYRFTAALAQNPVKVSLIGPDRISQRFAWERSQAIYKGMEEFIADVVAIERQMISELIAAG